MMNFRSFSSRRRPDLAIDLGTANMRMLGRNEGLVFDQPSLCCFRDDGGRSHFVAAGDAVLNMVDRVPKTFGIRRPLARGVLQDMEAASALLSHGLTTVFGKRGRARPNALIGIPADATNAEAKALLAAATDAGLGRIELVREPYAAAIGADLPVADACGSMIIECGAGTTEIAVFSIDGQCRTRSVRGGGISLDDVLIEHLQKRHHFLIGRLTAEDLKKRLSNRNVADHSGDENALEIKGRNLKTELPGTISLSAEEFTPLFEKHFAQFAQAIRVVLGEISPDLAADLLHERVVATGGGICAHFLGDAISRECGVPVTIAEDASGCVARGLERLLNH
jgi:rod shape-determining protein MreB